MLTHVLQYQIDRRQRSILFLDTLHERANNMLANEDAGMPPPPDFECETILDVRRFERPANYALLRITRCHDDIAADCIDDIKPPVIIVSAGVAKLEHCAILESPGDLDAHRPGLYEMKIINPTGGPDSRNPQYTVRFEERRVEQIRYPHPEQSFGKVQAVSESNELIYRKTLSPWITAFSNPWSAEMLKWLHPMRAGKVVFSEKPNPGWSG